ncbi:hypothetical protein [Nocardia arthritidis]|uniref:hypothetical protein n=1 Tax=Nocardia arthritidis TaxID=228602 RepID=UPI0007A4FE76|nr:hypothetical protein [Nocardia arthritidis]
MTPRTFREGAATAVDHAYGDPERAARQLGNTRAVAKTHYIDIPETFRTIGTSWNAGPAATRAKV